MGWGRKPLASDDGQVVTAFLTLAVLPFGTAVRGGHARPSNEDLLNPGGSNVEEIVRAEPQKSMEVYNEFDFADGLDSGPVTVSYGECRPITEEPVDFRPTIRRTEAFAASYHDLLTGLGEVRSPFRIVRREWFLADAGTPIVHVCFLR